MRTTPWLSVLAIVALVGCQGAGPIDPIDPPSEASEVRRLAFSGGMGPIPPPPAIRDPLVELGRLLAFDKELSGNRDVSCMSCHLPSQATSDGLTLSIGVRGVGLGPARLGDVFIPRNSPGFFNLHLVRSLFWDGRLEMESPGSMRTPAPAGQITAEMERAFEFGPISALGLFPVTSREEMREFDGNELAAVPDEEMRSLWDAIMLRLGAFAEYRERFEGAYPGSAFEEMNMAHASNAIGAFLVSEFAATNTAWDRFLAGDDAALTGEQMAGARIFLGEGRCAVCHSGPALSDGGFHNTALAELGPGKGHGPAGTGDFGREAVTGALAQRYAFRTTPLRNVALTGPWGHAGQFASLRGMVDHYSRSDEKLRSYDVTNLHPALRATVRTDEAILSTRDRILDGLVLTDEQVDLLVAFLGALTDDRSRVLDRVVPEGVPSGLPVDR